MEVPGVGWASAFQLGKGASKTLRIPMTVHAASRQKVMAGLGAKGILDGICLLKGGEDQNQYDTDMEILFRQDSWFNYLFGVKEPQFYGALSLQTKTATLFIPRLPAEYEVWCGKIQTPQYFKELYGVDEVLYVDELEAWLTKSLKTAGTGEGTGKGTGGTGTGTGDGENNGESTTSTSKIYLNQGVNSDSGLSAKPASFPGEAIFRAAEQVCEESLFPVLAGARVTKSDQEIEAMWYASFVAR